MLESGEEILADINTTLDQLVQNAQALKTASMSNYFTHEVEALQKTQESLLARLMHRQSILKIEQKKKVLESIRKESIHRKIAEYSKCTGLFTEDMNKGVKQKRRRARRRNFSKMR